MAPRKSTLYERPAPPDFGPERSGGGRYALALVFTLLLIAGLGGVFWAVYSMGVTARDDEGGTRAAVRVTPRPLAPAPAIQAPQVAARPVETGAQATRVTETRAPASGVPEIGVPDTRITGTGTQDASGDAAGRGEVETPGAAAVTAAPQIDPKVLAWGKAGELAAELEASFDCSEFAVRPAADGGPRIEGSLAKPADLERAQSMIEAKLPGAASLKTDLGCTVDLGGNYSAVADKAGDPRLAPQADITDAIWAVLPGAQFCETLGVVVETMPKIRRRFAADEALTIWVTRNDRPALCTAGESGWSVETPEPGGSARAVALLYNGDLLAVSAKAEPAPQSVQAPDAAPAPEPTKPEPSAPEPAPRSDAGPSTTDGAPSADGDVAEVASLTTASDPSDSEPPPVPSLRPARAEPESPSASSSPDELPELEPATSANEAPAGVSAGVSASALEPPSSAAEADDAARPAARRSVAPFAPPAVVMPANAPGADVGAAVQLEFTVRADGRAETFIALDAGTVDARVIAAAVEALSVARFPSPQPSDDGSYRGVYTVYLAPNPRAVSAQGAVASPSFTRPLTARDMDAVYPRRARERQRGGEVSLDCTVTTALGLECSVVDETPSGWDFGAAGVAAARRLRVGPTLDDGSPAPGHRFTLSIEFAPPT